MHKPYSQACENNKSPILDRISRIYRNGDVVLEIGTFTAQHILYFAEHMPQVMWQPSDTVEAQPTVRAGLDGTELPNILEPVTIDVADDGWYEKRVEGVFSANTLHIISLEHVRHFLRGAGRLLKPGGRLCVYGPFKYKGEFTTPSNADFDIWLKRRDPLSGVREFETVASWASDYGMRLMSDFPMPANNQLLVFNKVAVQN